MFSLLRSMENSSSHEVPERLSRMVEKERRMELGSSTWGCRSQAISQAGQRTSLEILGTPPGCSGRALQPPTFCLCSGPSGPLSPPQTSTQTHKNLCLSERDVTRRGEGAGTDTGRLKVSLT